MLPAVLAIITALASPPLVMIGMKNSDFGIGKKTDGIADIRKIRLIGFDCMNGFEKTRLRT